MSEVSRGCFSSRRSYLLPMIRCSTVSLEAPPAALAFRQISPRLLFSSDVLRTLYTATRDDRTSTYSAERVTEMGTALEIVLDDPIDLEPFICSICQDVSIVLCYLLPSRHQNYPAPYDIIRRRVASNACCSFQSADLAPSSSTTSRFTSGVQMITSSAPGAPLEFQEDHTQLLTAHLAAASPSTSRAHQTSHAPSFARSVVLA